MNFYRAISLLQIVALLVLGSCKDEEEEPASMLNAQWEIDFTNIVESGGEEACSYKIKQSDMFTKKDMRLICDKGVIYDFRKSNSLTIDSRENGCDFNSTERIVTKPYTRQGDRLMIDGTEHSIITLSQDTLILDYCAKLSPTDYNDSFVYLKMGIKLVKIKER